MILGSAPSCPYTVLIVKDASMSTIPLYVVVLQLGNLVVHTDMLQMLHII